MTATFGTRSVVAAAALVLGTLAAVAGTPERARNARLDVAGLARTVEREEDHVTAIELAQWIKERRAGLRVVDTRSTEEFDAFHIPTAERIPLSELPGARFRSDETIVLYSEGGTHAAQGWVFLRALGYNRVYFLRGGLYEWLDQVMSPSLSATASESARKEFARVSDLSRYFGGTPKTSEAVSSTPVIRIPVRRESARSSRAKVQEIRGRGC